ncbi:MAG TPA: hypothetical protein VLA77_01985 [Candidatus Saccharimonadales bacterium]|nr:hypothetical protein [Candidatus Saccharimonadales bacterium]
MKKSGFTFIEVILYVGLVSILVLSAVIFGWDAIYTSSKSQTQQKLSNSLRFASSRIELEIRAASAINSVTPTSVSLASLDAARNPTVIDLSSGRVRIGWGSSAPCPATNPCNLTPQDVNATLSFENLSHGNSNNIKFTIGGELTGDRSEFKASQTLTSASEVRAE